MADLGEQNDPFLAWYYGQTPGAAAPAAPDPLAINAGEYGILGSLAPGQIPPPPPPPPPPPKKLGPGSPQIEETAGPTPAAAPVVDPMTALNGITSWPPTSWASSPAPPAPVPLESAPIGEAPLPPPGQEPAGSSWGDTALSTDPWANTLPALPPPNVSAAAPAIAAANQLGAQRSYEDASAEDLGLGLAQIDPAAYEGYKASKIAEREAKFANDRAKQYQADTDWMQKNLAAEIEAKKKADAAAAQVDLEAKNISADGGYWASRTAPQKIANVLAAVIGGLVQGRTGGPNVGMQWIDKEIENHISAQRARLADRRSSVTRMYERLGTDYAGNEAMRLAAWRQVEGKLLTEQQNYDPRGMTAMRIADAIRESRAKQAEVLHRYTTDENKRQLEVAKFALDQQKQVQTSQQQALDLEERKRAARASEGLQAYGISSANKRSDAELAVKREELAAKANDQLEKLDREQGIGGYIGPDAKPGQLLQGDGKTVFHAPEKEHTEIAKTRRAVYDLLGSLSDLKALRAKAGGSNKLTSPDDQAEYNRLTNSAIIAYATSKGISLADEQSQKFARDAILGSDPSGYNVGDVVDRIDRSMGDVKSSYYNQLKGAGYTGKKDDAIQFVDPSSLPKAEPSPNDRQLQETLDSRAGQGVSSDWGFKDLVLGYTAGQAPGIELRKTLESEADRKKAIVVLDRLEGQARASGPDSARARADLQNIAGNAKTQEVRDLAIAALQRATPVPLPIERPSQVGVHEVAPGSTEYGTQLEQDRRRAAQPKVPTDLAKRYPQIFGSGE